MADEMIDVISQAWSDHKEEHGIEDSSGGEEEAASSEQVEEPEAEKAEEGKSESKETETQKVAAEPEVKAEKAEKTEEPKKEDKKADEEPKDELGPAKDKTGRENRIPHSRVAKIVANAEKRVKDAVEKETATKYANYDAYKQEVEADAPIKAILRDDPDRFIQMLSELPAYKERFTKMQAAPVAAPEPVPDEMPAPDTEGGYSAEGLKKLLSWSAAQAKKDVLAQVQPLLDKDKSEKERAAQLPVIQKKLNTARTNWEGFKENEQEIAAAYTADPTLSLDGAYGKVMIGKLKAEIAKLTVNKATVRAELIEELKKTPTSTSVAPASTKKTPFADKNASMVDIIKEATRRAGLK